ncbi:MAG: hypothetical protein RIQ52_1831 [Pseudomonadota bacterium]|jgi:hypothetical protein
MNRNTDGHILILVLFVLSMLGSISILLQQLASTEWQRSSRFITGQDLQAYVESRLALQLGLWSQQGQWQVFPACGEEAGWYAAGCPLPADHDLRMDAPSASVQVLAADDPRFSPVRVRVVESTVMHAQWGRHVTVTAHADARMMPVSLTLETGLWLCPESMMPALQSVCTQDTPRSWRVSP